MSLVLVVLLVGGWAGVLRAQAARNPDAVRWAVLCALHVWVGFGVTMLLGGNA